jgi:hypothetical protein
MNFARAIILSSALLAGGVASAFAGPALPISARTSGGVESLALEWFGQMQSGQIDRTQLTPEYSAQLTDDVVRDLSTHLKEDNYGASPTGAKVLRERSAGDQAFYVVKLIFPRGDAASLLIGLNTEGKVTGISFLSMAGD